VLYTIENTQSLAYSQCRTFETCKKLFFSKRECSLQNFLVALQPYTKRKLSWSLTCAKFFQLIASLSVVLPQLNLTKFKLEYLKSGFKDQATRKFIL